jgi:hypothetical protein
VLVDEFKLRWAGRDHPEAQHRLSAVR